MFNNAAQALCCFFFPEKGVARKSIKGSMTTNKYLRIAAISLHKHHLQPLKQKDRHYLFLNYLFPITTVIFLVVVTRAFDTSADGGVDRTLAHCADKLPVIF